MTVTLKSPRLRLVLETPNDGEYLEVDVQTDNRDLIQWDVVRDRNGWPTLQQGTMLWSTFIGWHAAWRTGGPVPDSFDEFRKLCVQVVPIDRDGTELSSTAQLEADAATDVDPTRPVPVPA